MAKSYEVLVHVAAGDLVEAACERVVSAAGKLARRELPGPGSKEDATVSFHQQRGGAIFLDKHLSLITTGPHSLCSAGRVGSL